MRISSVKIDNFRAIKSAHLKDLGDTVVIAGSNGCGKSCVLDAIRLFKSSYGGYQQNEWHQWFSEFQIDYNGRPQQITQVFRDRTLPVEIELELTLTSDERKFLKANAFELIREAIWTSVQGTRQATGAGMQREYTKQMEDNARALTEPFKKQLRARSFKGKITIETNFDIVPTESLVLDLVFSLYRPESLGVIDYHGAHRHYNRENVGGINLNIKSTEDRQRNHSLYGWANKYNNVKTEMAGAYVRDLIAREAGEAVSADRDLTATLKELFATFFPGKSFDGPVPTADAGLDFPVSLSGGGKHDINELSSGEKEVLFGYLRLRNTAPKHSVILLDEPELHLNPRLIRNLAAFYHKFLGRAFDNQLWLVTHSDTLLRGSIGLPGFTVFHMGAASSPGAADNQMHQIRVQEEADQAILDLVGDLATFNPANRVVFVESENSEFDVWMISELFPDLAQNANLVALGSKRAVRDVHDRLERAKNKGALGGDFYSIVDRDSDVPTTGGSSTQLAWDVYHIENYLLEEKTILKVVNDVWPTSPFKSKADILKALKASAKKTANNLVRHQIEQHVFRELRDLVVVNTDRNSSKVAANVTKLLAQKAKDVQSKLGSELSPTTLEDFEKDSRASMKRALKGEKWKREFKGRDILREFTSSALKGKLRYEEFRNLIVARMRDDGVQPKGMVKVINKILDE